MASSYGASEDTALIGGITPHRHGPGQPGTPNSRTSAGGALRILGIAACVLLFLTIAYIPGGISGPRSSATRLGGTSSSAVTHAGSKNWEEHGYDEDEYFELPDDLEAAIAELIIDDDLIASLGAARDDEIIPGVESRIEGTTDEGFVVSTKGGQKTQLRIKMLQEMQEAEDINTETESNQQEFAEQCAVDEGSLAILEPDFSAFEAFENHLIEMHEGQYKLSALNESMPPVWVEEEGEGRNRKRGMMMMMIMILGASTRSSAGSPPMAGVWAPYPISARRARREGVCSATTSATNSRMPVCARRRGRLPPEVHCRLP